MNLKSLAACVVALVCLQLGPTPARSATPKEALNSNVELKFTSASVENLVEYLELYSKVNVDLDAGVDPQQRLGLKLNEMPLKDALPRALEPLGLKYEAQANRLLISRIDASLPPPEYGFRVQPMSALDGWISLFDGQTTFGWTGGELKADSAGRTQLIGGRTNASFGACSLEVWVSQKGSLTAGGKSTFMLPGQNLREVDGAGPIILGDLTGVLWLSIKPKGLQPLFNGRDLGDWKRIDHAKLPESKRPRWRVEDGGLRAIGGPGCVEYPKLYGDFVLQVDVRTRAQYANGGVFVRSIPGDFMNGYEAQVYNRCIDNDPAKPFTWSTGSIDDRQLARRVVSRDHVTYRMTVVANGPHLATWVNGYQLVDWTDTRAKHENARHGLRTEPGTLQLQAHDPETDVEFRGVYIAPLE